MAMMNARNPRPVRPCIDSTRARRVRGMARPKVPTVAPNSDRIRTHSIIEPSWFPHVPLIL